MFQYILFDLDGTLTDPKEGITKSVQFALLQQGIHERDLDKLEPFIGPPLLDSFMDFYHMTQEEAQIAVSDYRKRFAPIGIFENKLYPGIPEMLGRLQKAGIRLAVASSKPEVFVKRILEHFSLETYFDVVVGSELDGRRTEKEEAVEEALRRLGVLMDAPHRIGAMVGDRRFDIKGGKRYGLTTAGVSWGYAGKGELEAAGADYIARSVTRLERFLLSGQPPKERKTDRKGAQGAGAKAAAQDVGTKITAQEAGTKTAAKADGTEPAAKEALKRCADILLPFLLYYTGYHACFFILAWLVACLWRSGAPAYFQKLGLGSGLLGDLARACSMLAGAALLLPLLRRERAAGGSGGRKAERGRLSYLSVGLLLGTAALGLNILFELTGITALSERYAQAAQLQYQTPFAVGLILFGVISPLSEELLFRGLLYRRLRRFLSAVFAGALSALLFGVYHGNVVQGLYAALLGLLLAFVYERDGRLRMAVFGHGAANAVVFALTYDTQIGAAVGSPVNCAIFLTISLLTLLRMIKSGKLS